MSQIHNVRLFLISRKEKRSDTPLSILTGPMNSETKKRRYSLGDTPDTPLGEEQMEVPSSFDESLVRNGRLHWTPYSRRRAREIYETAGIVQHVTETKKCETIRPFPRLRLFRVTMTGESGPCSRSQSLKSHIFLCEIKKLILCTGNIRLLLNRNREMKSEKFFNYENNKPAYLNPVCVRFINILSR